MFTGMAKRRADDKGTWTTLKPFAQRAAARLKSLRKGRDFDAEEASAEESARPEGEIPAGLPANGEGERRWETQASDIETGRPRAHTAAGPIAHVQGSAAVHYCLTQSCAKAAGMPLVHIVRRRLN